MSSPPEGLVLRLCLRWVGLVARVVPRSFRPDWRQEWEAELRHRWHRVSGDARSGWRSRLDLLRQALGALPDAAWLRQQLTADAELLRDTRHGVRLLRRNRGFTVAAVLIVAVGIGANTTIFSAVDALLLRDPPYPDADRIVMLWQRDVRAGAERARDDVAPANFLDWRERTRAFEVMAAADPYSYDLQGVGEPEVLFAMRVTEGFFDVFGVQPLLGRTFRPDDHRTGAAPVAVLGYRLWERRFGADRAIVGRALSLDEGAFTVVGVLPPHFEPGLMSAAGERGLWVPKAIAEHDRRVRGSAFWNVVGRLKRGVTLAQAQADMDAIAGGLGREYPRTNGGVGVHVQPLQDHLAGERGPALFLLWAAVALVLAVACANVAGLLLARGAERQYEFAIRTALGAGRARLVRQLVAEGLLLAALGALGGLLLSRWGVQGLVALLPPDLPRLDEVRIQGRVLAFTAALATLSGLFFGLAPAARLLRRDLAPRSGMQAATVRGRGREAGAALVVGEVALALVLLAGAGLLTRSFVALRSLDPGFRADRVLMLQVFAWDRNRTPERRSEFFAQTLERVTALPGVAAAGAVLVAAFRRGRSSDRQPAPDRGPDGCGGRRAEHLRDHRDTGLLPHRRHPAARRPLVRRIGSRPVGGGGAGERGRGALALAGPGPGRSEGDRAMAGPADRRRGRGRRRGGPARRAGPRTATGGLPAARAGADRNDVLRRPHHRCGSGLARGGEGRDQDR